MKKLKIKIVKKSINFVAFKGKICQEGKALGWLNPLTNGCAENGSSVLRVFVPDVTN